MAPTPRAVAPSYAERILALRARHHSRVFDWLGDARDHLVSIREEPSEADQEVILNTMAPKSGLNVKPGDKPQVSEKARPEEKFIQAVNNELVAQIDELIGEYKDLQLKVMGTASNKKKRAKASGISGLNINKSKGKGKEPEKTAPRLEKWMEEKQIFTPKSKLPDLDVHSYLAKPEAWNSLSNEEKSTIRSLLPETTPYNDDGSPSREFLKYNTDWRNGVRQFQDDVRAGRMDPKWQAEAAQAMEERAAGKFDRFKEEQFEEFWGQKQVVSSSAAAGDSSKVRLEELVRAGIFRVGDIWSYSRSFARRKKGSILVEKEATIGQLQNGLVVLLIPPGQLKHMPVRFKMDLMAAEAATFMEDAKDDYEAQELHETSPTPKSPTPGHVLTFDDPLQGTASNSPSKSLADDVPGAIIYTKQDYAGLDPPKERLSKAKIFAVQAPGKVNDKEPQILRVRRLHGLERKILQMDGRTPFDGKASSWRFVRCLRDNQDMGSLFQIREEYFNRYYVS